MKYAYQRQGGPLLNWGNAAPPQSRAADARSLGSLGDDTLGAMAPRSTFKLPKPGAPEQVQFGALGCSSCRPVSGVDDAIGQVILENKFLIGLGIAMYIGQKFFKKKRRR